MAQVGKQGAPAGRDGGGKAGFLSAFSTNVREKLERALSERTFSAGEVIFRDGDPGDGCYILREGRVMLYAKTGDGSRKIFDILGPSDILGEMSLIDGEPRCATAEAASDVRAGFLSVSDFERVVLSDADSTKALLRILVHRLRRTDLQVEELVFLGVPGRLARALLTLGEKFQEKVGNPRIPLKHAEIADIVGTTREYVSRFLSQFQQDNCVKLERGLVEITDPERLSTWIT